MAKRRRTAKGKRVKQAPRREEDEQEAAEIALDLLKYLDQDLLKHLDQRNKEVEARDDDGIRYARLQSLALAAILKWEGSNFEQAQVDETLDKLLTISRQR